MSASSSAFSCASCAERKRRERCWFIFARGAGPSIAMKSSLRGRTTPPATAFRAGSWDPSSLAGSQRPVTEKLSKGDDSEEGLEFYDPEDERKKELISQSNCIE